MSENRSPQIVCFGEILWDIFPGGEVPGGAPVNVAYHLNKLGHSPTIVTRIGMDNRGEELLSRLEALGLETNFVQTDDEVMTGIVNATADERGDVTYDIVSPAAWDNIHCDKLLEEKVKNSGYFIFGSLAARGPRSAETLRTLLSVAQVKVCDINLRPPYVEQALVEHLLTTADIVKMNDDELQQVCGWYETIVDTREQIGFLRDKFNISKLIVTRGARGAIANIDGDWFESAGISVQVADTVGSGDAFLAAFLSRIIKGESPQSAIDFASGLGAFVATRNGAWPDYEPADIAAILSRGNGESNY